MESVEKNEKGEVTVVKVKAIPGFDSKVKGVIQWISKEHAIPCVLNIYNQLMTVEDVAETSKKEGKDWLEYFNTESLIVKPNALVWDLHKNAKQNDRF